MEMREQVHSACRWPDTRRNIRQECLRSMALHFPLFSTARATREGSHTGNLPIVPTDVRSSQHSTSISFVDGWDTPIALDLRTSVSRAFYRIFIIYPVSQGH